MSEKDTISSAVLTATIKSLNTLIAMQREQNKIIAVVNGISEAQAASQAHLERIDKLVTTDEFIALDSKVDTLNANVDQLDLVASTDKIIESVNTSKDTVITDITASIVEGNTELRNQLDEGHNESMHTLTSLKAELLDAINGSNSVKHLEAMKRLIDGLKNMHENELELARRIETLSNNVTGSRNDTKMLSSTVIDSNARVASMDMRMAAFISLKDTNTTDVELDNLDNTVAFLESLSDGDDVEKSGNVEESVEVAETEDIKESPNSAVKGDSLSESDSRLPALEGDLANSIKELEAINNRTHEG